MRTLAFILLMVPFALACDSNGKVTGNVTLPARVTVDLISDFGEMFVVVEFDGQRYFSAYPSGMEPFSGPQMSFVTSLDRGEHLLGIQWRKFSEALTVSHRDSARIEIGDRDSYHIGLYLRPNASGGDSLRVIMQEYAFGYL